MSGGLQLKLIVESDIATTQLLERTLNECKKYGVGSEKLYLNELHLAGIPEGSLPLFVRNADQTAASWCKRLKRNGWPYCYYIDDNFWEISGDSALARYYQDASVRRSLNYIVENATLVIVNSTQLALYIRDKFNVRTCSLPAMFDFSLLKGIRPFVGEEVRIGFAGSTSRVGDLAMIHPLIETVLARYPTVVFEFAGAMPASLSTSPRVRFFPHVGDYAQFIKFQRSRGWKIGLAPLIADSSNRFKTNNKFREYAACGIAGIYSDSPSYQDSVVHLVNGIVVRSTDAQDWLLALEQLLNSPELVNSIASAAYDYALKNYDLPVIAKEWSDTLLPFSEKIAVLKSRGIKPGRVSKFDYTLSRVSAYWLLIRQAYYEGGWALVLKKTYGLLKKRLFNVA